MFEQKEEQESLTNHVCFFLKKFHTTLLHISVFYVYTIYSSLSKTVNTSILPPPPTLHGIPNFPHVASHNRRRRKGFQLISISLFFALSLVGEPGKVRKYISEFLQK